MSDWPCLLPVKTHKVQTARPCVDPCWRSCATWVPWRSWVPDPQGPNRMFGFGSVFSLSTTYLGDLAFQNHRLQSSSSDGPPRGVRSKETLAILGPRKIAGGTRDHQGFEGFKVPWRSWVHAAMPAKQENIIASSQISRLAIFRPDLPTAI